MWNAVVSESQAGWRLDLFLVESFPMYSRTQLRNAIMAGAVTIQENDSKPTHGRPGFRLKPGHSVTFVPPEPQRETPKPEAMPLEILYEDDDCAVINKRPNIVIHPSRGHWDGTLVAGLAHHYEGQLSSVRGPQRPGIVHRLDRDTSGAILVAKNDIAHAQLAALFQNRQIVKEYLALVIGVPEVDRDLIDAPIGLHPKQREKMAIAPNDPDAKEAQTYYEVLERFYGFSLLKCKPLTGRTHQIRVHLTSKGYPILCDRLYYSSRSQITFEEIAGKRPIAIHGNAESGNVLLSRQALHAHRLSFTHPINGCAIDITAPMPADMQSVLDALRKYRIR